MTAIVCESQRGQSRESKEHMESKKQKCLIAYFSRAGYNYVSGAIIDLAVGNTEVLARMIGDATGGVLARIIPNQAYPDDYHEATRVAQSELRMNARPSLTLDIENIGNYDVVFLGYPNWWGTMPMPVWTFLEQYGFAGKTIIPFCTHEGSGMGHSERDIATLCPQAKLKKGLAIQGAYVGSARQLVQNWIQKIDL